MSLEGVPSIDAASAVRRLLREAGLRPALEYLNGRTRHRYTGVYRFDPPWLRSLELYDREFPMLRTRSASRLDETYCSLVRASRSAFTTVDAQHDTRLREHPAREAVAAYCGVPLFDSRGQCFGSLCHFDSRPRLLLERDLALLEAVAGDVAAVAARLFFSDPLPVALPQVGDEMPQATRQSS